MMLLVDCKRALAWVRENIAVVCGGDPECVVACGESAGGHISLCMALTANNPLYQPGFEDVDTRVQGVVDCFGVHDFMDEQGQWTIQKNIFGRPTKIVRFMKLFQEGIVRQNISENPHLWRQISPLQLLKDLPPSVLVPPIFGFHGIADSIVPIADATHFYEQLAIHRQEARIQGNNTGDVFIALPNAQHGFTTWPSLRSCAVSDGMMAFLNHLTRPRSSRQPTTTSSQ
eukprot:TRINITY_DN1775_c0_g1_i4.p1 TRINITY_DN1775_c0_g1~~TRINITY_DN1775_c0_g1_i4.p1  ORF type:complete len:229 (-),score=45.01 TRINITY_DN1775_c0_g1_i4:51-737(-)